MKAKASTAEFEGTLDHRWISQLGALDVRLRAAGFLISPDRWLNIADLLTDLMLQNGINKNERYYLNVKQYLSPLICKSAVEQQEFSRVFSSWWEDVYPSEIDIIEEPEGADAEHKIVNRFSNFTLAAGLLILLVVTVVTASIYFDLFKPDPPPDPITLDCSADPTLPGCSSEDIQPDCASDPMPPDCAPEPEPEAPTQVDSDPENQKPDIKPRIETEIPPIFSLSDPNLSLIQLILVSLLPLFMALILLIGAFRPMLRKGKADPDNPLRFLTLSLAKDDLFDDPKLRAAIRSLHAPLSLPTTRLHPKRTVYASLQQGGLFSPVFASRAEVPEVMVWVNNKGKLDPMQAFADTLVERLRAADLRVVVYSYRKRPNRLLDRATNKWHSGTDVQALHQGARLILITSSQGLIDVWSQKALLWVSNLAKQFNTVVLEPSAHHIPNKKILKAVGIESCALSSEGIRQVCASFSKTSQAIATQYLAVLPQYLDQEERWRSPVKPNKNDLKKLLLTLQSYLGESGYSLLCASAVYPEFRWGLIRALDLSLFTQDSAIQRETRLLALAQLSWARDGWLPEWLRSSLMRSQSKSQHETVRMLYQQLLVEVEIHGEESVHLPVRIHKPKGNLRSYLRQWIKRSKQNSDLEDSVFVELMLGGRFRRLDFELPRALEKFFRVSNTMRHMISTVSLISFAAMLSWGINGLANHYSIQNKIQQIWNNYIASDKSLDIAIYHNQLSLLLGEQLQFVLYEQDIVVNRFLTGADGNQNDILRQQIENEIQKLKTQDLPIDGLILHQANYEQQAIWLAKRVAFASYGLQLQMIDMSELSGLADSLSGLPQVIIWLDKAYQEPLVLSGHTNVVYYAAFNPDATRIVTASYDKTARVWDTASGQPLHTLTEHTGGVYHAAFSPDGTRIATASFDKTARVWDTVSGKPLHTLAGHTGGVNQVAFSPDGTRIVTTSFDNTVRVWDTVSGKPRHTLTGHSGRVHHVAFSPDGTRIVTASIDNTARVWDTVSGKPLHTLTGHSGNVRHAVFSPDGTRIVTASFDSTARVWDTVSGKPLHILTGHNGEVTNAAFSPDGTRIVTASFDSTARVWDTVSGKPLHTLTGHTGGINQSAFSPDGTRIVTAAFDNAARVWDTENGKPLHTLTGHTGYVNQVAFSPDGTNIVTASVDKTARVWNIQSEIDKQANSLDIKNEEPYSSAEKPTLGFFKVSNAAIQGHNTKHFKNRTIEECANLCEQTTIFSCKSFDYHKATNDCDLSDKSRKDVPLKRDYKDNPYDHYDRSFALFANAAIFGHNTKQLTNVTVEACATACEQTTGFYCKSFDYHKFSNVCDLSDKSRIDIPLKRDYDRNPYDHYERVVAKTIEESKKSEGSLSKEMSVRSGWVYFGSVVNKGTFINKEQAKNIRSSDASDGERIGVLKPQQTVNVIESKRSGWTLVQFIDE